MKKKILVSALILMGGLLVSQPAHASFTNGGFEDGTLNGWTGGGGSWNGGGYPVDPATYNGGTPNNTVVGVGVDPITGQSTVYNGSYAVRVNDSINNYSVSTIRQSVTNYAENDIFFEWNAVLEASHNLTDSDYFSLSLTDDTEGTVLVNRQYSSASAPGTFAYLNNGWYGSGWQVEHIDLLALGAVGHDFTLTLLASDCPYSGHAGYVYLDGFDSIIVPPDSSEVPEPATMLLFGTGLAGLAGLRRRKK